MTAVATAPSFQPIARSSWGTGNGNQGGLNSMSSEEVTRMFMPRKTAQRTNSSSSIASSASSASTSSTSTISPQSSQPNGVPQPATGDLSGWAARKKPARGLWPSSKAEPTSSLSNARPHSVTAMGPSAASTMSNMHQPSAILPSQHTIQGQQQQNGTRTNVGQSQGESNAILCLLPMNGTFERKTINVPFYQDNLRIGRQTNAKTIPTPANGYFDSKVLSRQHAEIWADRLGKIWIKDVKSSNGTFVNGQRLSAENRDSEPHELREQDILELGIDIVSEDQKTVVHHKVAARVEHAGFYGNSTNVMDLNFGDIDPTVGGGMMASSLPQNMPHLRGRGGSQGSMNSNGRMVSGTPSVAGTNTTSMGQQRHMNFWLTPVSIEQIVKRLSVSRTQDRCGEEPLANASKTDLRTAKDQSSELHRTGEFFSSLIKDSAIPEEPKPLSGEQARGHQVNGSPLKVDPKTRFSEPPAPPPQQPLPEKPDSTRGSVPDFTYQPHLKRSDTERPKISSNSSPTKTDPSNQIISLVEALASAKRELDSQGVRVKNLEEMLQKERIARETAEERAQRLELESPGSRGVVPNRVEAPTSGDASEHAMSSAQRLANGVYSGGEKTLTLDKNVNRTGSKDLKSEVESAGGLKQRMDQMAAEMDDMKQLVERYKSRAETAEHESATTRQSLAEMVEKIRRDDNDRASTRQSSHQSTESRKRNASPSKNRDGDLAVETASNPSFSLENIVKRAGVQNGKPIGPEDVAALEKAVSAVLMRPARGSRHDQLMQTAPYASIFGVVILGVGLMAFLNGWQKVER
ncbi:MAG: hypothetical protein M1837_006719 [Sclerophora amabilis]|nr:MAG: hypothetical protein M1837_006719 [Sclerophora amabilis]